MFDEGAKPTTRYTRVGLVRVSLGSLASGLLTFVIHLMSNP